MSEKLTAMQTLYGILAAKSNMFSVLPGQSTLGSLR